MLLGTYIFWQVAKIYSRESAQLGTYFLASSKKILCAFFWCFHGFQTLFLHHAHAKGPIPRAHQNLRNNGPWSNDVLEGDHITSPQCIQRPRTPAPTVISLLTLLQRQQTGCAVKNLVRPSTVASVRRVFHFDN